MITVQTIAGHTLFSCTVGDLGGVSGVGDVSLDSWSVLDGMVNVVKRTGHSSYYVEKGMSAMSKGQAGAQSDLKVYGGGECALSYITLAAIYACQTAFPIWLEVCVYPLRFYSRNLKTEILERPVLPHRCHRMLLRFK